jgi:hypothetical protein
MRNGNEMLLFGFWEGTAVIDGGRELIIDSGGVK